MYEVKIDQTKERNGQVHNQLHFNTFSLPLSDSLSLTLMTKQKISKDTEDLNNPITQLNLINIYRGHACWYKPVIPVT
jgi:hypothetical protein